MFLWFRNPVHGGSLSVWASWGTALNEIILISTESCWWKVVSKAKYVLACSFLFDTGFSKMLKNIKYSCLVWMEAVHGCRSTSDGDLFVCWQEMLHFFSRTGSKVDQLEQGSLLLLKKPKLFCAWEKIFPVHEQRKDRPLGQAVGSLQLILTLSVVQIWAWCVFPLTSELYLPLASEARF